MPSEFYIQVTLSPFHKNEIEFSEMEAMIQILYIMLIFSLIAVL